LADLIRDWRSVNLNPADSALCHFAARLTHHQNIVSQQDIDNLRNVGFSDRAIHDAVQVIAYFNYITRIADALGVELETDIPNWGGSSG
jgi:uncharacterized peroxidase-related enzyme